MIRELIILERIRVAIRAPIVSSLLGAPNFLANFSKIKVPKMPISV